jgi:hypothetical protein
VLAKPGDRREDEMTPYLKRSAKASVRFETRSEVKSELMNFMTLQVSEER